MNIYSIQKVVRGKNTGPNLKKVYVLALEALDWMHTELYMNGLGKCALDVEGFACL